MDITETRDRILSDDAFVEEQIEVIKTYYKLKHTIRWEKARDEIDVTESVAEHVYGMQVLAEYFLPFEPDLDHDLVRSLIVFHDMAEALVSDVRSQAKTDLDREREKAAEYKLITNAPPHLRERLEQVFMSYNAQETAEARFVKALDKIEIPFHLYFISTTEAHQSAYDLGWAADDYTKYRQQYLAGWPVLERFDAILARHNDNTPYFPEMTHGTIV